MTTPPPAQAVNEKALIEAAKAYNDSLDGRHFGATRRIIETYLAALRPEGEAVAWRLVDDDGDHWWGPSASKEEADEAFARNPDLILQPLYPPAPAQVETASLPLKMLVDRDQFRTMIEQSPDEECEAGVLHPEAPAPAPAPGGVVVEDWRDDPAADERWNAGCDFAMTRLCCYLGIDPAAVSWDAATETVDGDVSAVIGNILRAKFGEDWLPASPPAPAGVNDALAKLDEARVSIFKSYRHLAAREVALMNEAYDAVAAACNAALATDASPSGENAS